MNNTSIKQEINPYGYKFYIKLTICINMKIIVFCIIALTPALGCTDDASSREYIKENDPEISQALGIGTIQFEDCFYATTPQQQYYTQNTLLPCLQQYNPSITEDLLNTVLEQYRPER